MLIASAHLAMMPGMSAKLSSRLFLASFCRREAERYENWAARDGKQLPHSLTCRHTSINAGQCCNAGMHRGTVRYGLRHPHLGNAAQTP